MATNRGLLALAIAAIAVSLIATSDAQARFRRGGSCGSWGGSSGSNGSWGGSWGGSRGSWGSRGGSYNNSGGSHGGYQANNCGCNGNGNSTVQNEQSGERHESNYRGPEMNAPQQARSNTTQSYTEGRPSLRTERQTTERVAGRSDLDRDLDRSIRDNRSSQDEDNRAPDRRDRDRSIDENTNKERDTNKDNSIRQGANQQ